MFEDDILDVSAVSGRYRDAGFSKEKALQAAIDDYGYKAEQYLQDSETKTLTNQIHELGPVEETTIDEAVLDDRFEGALELHAIHETCARHNIPMTDTNYRLSAITQNYLMGSRVSGGIYTMPKLEDLGNGMMSGRELTLHMEDTSKFSLKTIWEKIKQAFVNAFNRIRTWYIKAFDATNKLGKKAAAIKASAEGKQGVINETSFEFGGLKSLNYDGKVPDPAKLTAGINRISSVTQGLLGRNAKSYNDMAENFGTALEDMIKAMPTKSKPSTAGTNTTVDTSGSTPDFTTPASSNPSIAKIQASVNEVKKTLDGLIGGSDGLDIWDNAAQDKRFKELAESGKAILYHTKETMPGNKVVVISIPITGDAKGNAGREELNSMKQAFGLSIEEPTDKGREVEGSGQFKTLSTSQVIAMCDYIMDACKVGLEYKLMFATREKAMENLSKELDRTVSQADSLEGQQMTFVKANVSAVTSIMGKINSGEARWYKYAMGTFSAALDYCQGSLAKIN